jgi:CheY-like chemotaxis protein
MEIGRPIGICEAEDMKLLVVDDHPLIREALQHVLRALGVSVELLEAETCVQAMERTRHNQDSSLILLDRALPGVDGFEALRQLREEFPAIPVVVFSAYEQQETSRFSSITTGAAGRTASLCSRALVP